MHLTSISTIKLNQTDNSAASSRCRVPSPIHQKRWAQLLSCKPPTAFHGVAELDRGNPVRVVANVTFMICKRLTGVISGPHMRLGCSCHPNLHTLLYAKKAERKIPLVTSGQAASIRTRGIKARQILVKGVSVPSRPAPACQTSSACDNNTSSPSELPS
jgi:hypothetical protein